MKKIIILLSALLLISSLVLAALPPPPPTPGGFGENSGEAGEEPADSVAAGTTTARTATSPTVSPTAAGTDSQQSITSLAQRASALETRMLALEKKAEGMRGGEWPTPMLFLIALNIVLLGLAAYLLKKMMGKGYL